jgi:hypothetical protein
MASNPFDGFDFDAALKGRFLARKQKTSFQRRHPICAVSSFAPFPHLRRFPIKNRFSYGKIMPVR